MNHRRYRENAERLHREACDDPEWCTYPAGENHCQAAVDAENEAVEIERSRPWTRFRRGLQAAGRK